jgi:hypothetical protein
MKDEPYKPKVSIPDSFKEIIQNQHELEKHLELLDKMPPSTKSEWVEWGMRFQELKRIKAALINIAHRNWGNTTGDNDGGTKKK